MKMNRWLHSRTLLVIPLLILLFAAGGATSYLFALCGPFTDVGASICPFVLEVFYSGIASGTSETTFSPDDPVTRGQDAVFLANTLDQSIQRANRRAALNQWWATNVGTTFGLGLTTVGPQPNGVGCDGFDVWAASPTSGTVARVSGRDGRPLETWVGAAGAFQVQVAMGRVFVTGSLHQGALYMIDPSQPGPTNQVKTVVSNLGTFPGGIAFDGSRLWVANIGINGTPSVAIVSPSTSFPWPVTTITDPGIGRPMGVLFDGVNVWVTDNGFGTIMRFDSHGSILQTIPVGPSASFPVFDGTNIWVPNSNAVTVIRASSGEVVTTLYGNGLSSPSTAAFDGQRVLVTDYNGSSVSLFKAADLTPLGYAYIGLPGTGAPVGACSDGVNFWVALQYSNQVARF